jgi:hypothetical protein
MKTQLLAPPSWTASLDERLASLLEVIGGNAGDLGIDRHAEAGVRVAVPSDVDRAPGASDGQRRLRGEASRELVGRRAELVVPNDSVCESNAQCLGGVDDIAEEDELAGSSRMASGGCAARVGPTYRSLAANMELSPIRLDRAHLDRTT